MSKKDWETDGYRCGFPVYCPVSDYGGCPYCDEHNLCHITDPIEDCEDFAMFWESWDVWSGADDVDPDTPESFAEDEIKWAGDAYGYDDEMFDRSYEEAEKDML